jgi:hypothetical protein
MKVYFVWKDETLCLIELSSLWQFITLEIQQISTLNSIQKKRGLTKTTQKYVWQDSSGNGGLRVLKIKGSRLIACHAGSVKTGFISDTNLITYKRYPS